MGQASVQVVPHLPYSQPHMHPQVTEDSEGFVYVCMHIYIWQWELLWVGGREREDYGCGTHFSSLICCYLPSSTLCCNHSQKFPGNILPCAFYSTGMCALACPMFSRRYPTQSALVYIIQLCFGSFSPCMSSLSTKWPIGRQRQVCAWRCLVQYSLSTALNGKVCSKYLAGVTDLIPAFDFM